MDERSIGVFDSGVGGLTAVKRLRQLLPRENIVYLGDTGRVPYGSRSRETIIKYAREDAGFLLSRGVKAIMSACNTVSSAAIEAVRETAGAVPVFDVVDAPSREASAVTKNRRVGVLGTAATVRSGAYIRALSGFGADIEVLQTACPLFVPLAENGRTAPDDEAALIIARGYLADMLRFGADTVILGCTHYPLLRGVIAKTLGGAVALIDSGAAAAEATAARLAGLGLLSSRSEPGTAEYFVTDSPDGFAEPASRFLGTDIAGNITQVSLSEN
ncbi:MAG: glutamate racemase [Oscillospiraceae bacterium]|jgi:glutamate racemase|nr:glutamate racemase [Oscillospiraceae bacterium]